MKIKLWMQKNVKGVSSRLEEDVDSTVEASDLSVDVLDGHDVIASIDEIVKHASATEKFTERQLKVNPNQKHEGPYLLIQLGGETRTRKLPAERRGRCWRLPSAIGISYSLLDQDELESITTQLFDGSAISLDTVFEYDYSVLKKSGSKGEEVDSKYRKQLESKLNQALKTYQAQLYIKAELRKINLCEIATSIYEGGKKLSDTSILRRLDLPPLTENRLTAVDGEIQDDLVAIREESNGGTGGYRVVDYSLLKELQAIYSRAANIYGVNLPKIT